MKKKILLVEDDPSISDIYKEVLTRNDFSVEAFNTGKEALAYFDDIKQGAKEKPDLALLDLILPDVNGMEILKKAKEDEKLKDISFFLLTNYTDTDLEKDSLEKGAEKYIVKASCLPSQLVETIKEWFKKKGA